MANKKINQLVAKTTIQSTDLFPLGDATTGQLFKKTIAELQAAIGGAVISVNGLVGTVVLDTDDIQELAGATNKYFTDARARAAISLTTSGNSGASTYSNSTGVLNVPTYTLAGLGGITASFLSGASGIAYNSSTGVITYTGTVYTDASIRALFSAGSGITYNSSTGAISYSGTVYTDASIRALISLTTSGSSGASTYSNTTGVLNVPTYTLAGLGGIGAGFLSGGAGITYNSSTGVIASTITQYTDALARASISAGTGISYNSGTGVITYNGTVYTDSSIRSLISGGTGITYNSSTGAISYSGTVYTDSSVRGLLSGTAPITYNSSTGAIGITQSSTSANGFLSSTDWNTFNGKQNALTLGNITEVNSNVFMFPDGGTGKTIGNFSIQMIQAGATYNGYLSSTDWTTFNNKQNAITLTTTGTSGASTFSAGTLNIPQYQREITLTTTGTSGNATLSSGTLNIPNYGSAISGTTNYVTKFTSSTAIGNSALQEVSGILALGATPSSWTLFSNVIELNGGTSIGSFSNTTYLSQNVVFNSGFKYKTTDTAGRYELGQEHKWFSAPSGTAGNAITFTQAMTLDASGRLGIGTTSPAEKLDINGALAVRASTASFASATGVGMFDQPTTGITRFLSFGPNTSTLGSYQFYISGANNTGGLAAMTISSSGNVGLGTTAPNERLAVNGNLILQSGYQIYGNANSGSTSSYLSMYNSTDGGIDLMANFSTSKITFGTAGTERIRISSAGYLGIGTNSPKTFLDVVNDADVWHGFFGGATSKLLIGGQSGSGGVVLQAGNSSTANNAAPSTTYKMMLQRDGGNLLVGTSSDNGERLYVSGSIRATGSITANSDVRLKKNIERIENALQKVSEISGYTYNTIYDEDRHAGVIAQEIDKVLPEIVNKGNDGLMGVEYGNISALLIEAIKDLKKDNESLRAIVEGLTK